MLTTTDHNRDSAGLTYVYPVLSRRAGGLSIGINLNPNNACNWLCVYCQVPELKRGAAPIIDQQQLGSELRDFIEQVQHGDFFDQHQVSAEMRVIKDIAFSGNGEPTSAEAFDQIVAMIGNIVKQTGLYDQIKLTLITNGSLLQRHNVQKGLMHLGEMKGEIWFKLDSATEKGMMRINNINRGMNSVMKNLDIACRLAPTWLQTCVFEFDEQAPSEDEQHAYLQFLTQVMENNTPLKGVLLYGLARPSMQVEADRLKSLPDQWLENFSDQIQTLGLEVKTSV